MHVHLFGADAQTCARWHTCAEAIREVITRVVGGSGERLVVLVSLVDGVRWAAECHHGWFTPADVHRGQVSGLPPHFHLIELAFGVAGGPYLWQTRDDYGWVWRFGSFVDHLAAVMSHELYHYTQPHFARWRWNNEGDANAWALAHCRRLGFAVEAEIPAA